MSYYTLSNLTDAVPAALFGIFALWAASSSRHWFVRTSVVVAALLVLLLIPAFEVVIQLTCVVVILIVSLSIWRRRRQHAACDGTAIGPEADRIPRLSLATLLLFVVVFAVVTSVAARVPVWPVWKWAAVLGLGVMGGCVGVACVWIACGQTALWLRLLAFPLLLLGFTVVTHVSAQVPEMLSDLGKNVYHPIEHYWDAALKSASWGMWYWSRSIGLGMAIMIVWLFVIRRAGWFDPLGERLANCQPAKIDRGTAIARRAAIALFVLIALLPLVILYRMILPPAIPTLKLPEPNGWDDLMAAGEMIGPDTQRALLQWMRTNSDLPPGLYRSEAIALIRRGLDRKSVNPYMFHEWPDSQVRPFSQVHVTVSAYAYAAERSNDLHRQLDAYWDLLRLTNEQGRAVGNPARANTGWEQWESMALAYYWPIRTRLSQQQCIELAAKLYDYDMHRDSYEDKCARQRIIDMNADWETRLNTILSDWSGRDPYSNGPSVYGSLIRLRFLIVDLAIRAYQMKHKKLPETIDELVPEFFPAVPKDPLGTGPIVYRRVKDGYTIYSVGPDADDDDGRPVTSKSWDGDYTTDLMFQ